MLSDIFLLVGCAVCSHAGRPAECGGEGRIRGRSPPVRCRCPQCALLLRIRCECIFVGPAPR
eukprot:9024054-Pyramimonas_sp.AAC.1